MTQAQLAALIQTQLKLHGYDVSEVAAMDVAAQIVMVIGGMIASACDESEHSSRADSWRPSDSGEVQP